MRDLYARLKLAATHPITAPAKEIKTEAGLQDAVRVAYNATGGLLWRNNVGAASDSYGNFFRYGLANDTKGMSKVIKSADLIGIRPITIKEQHIGETFGQFISYEIKEPGWKPSNSGREKAQSAWAALVRTMGGDARFISEVGQIW